MATLSEHIQARPGLTNGQWAQLLGVSRPYLHGLLSGDRQPSLETAIEIERATDGGVPILSWPNLAAVVEAAMATEMRASKAPAGESVVLPDGLPALGEQSAGDVAIGDSLENQTGGSA
jgi:DNA-binding transcriptional regulator YdaS (Cro superfamily)